MSTFSFKVIQNIPVGIDVAWDFFSNPANLQSITPENIGFSIISKYHGGIIYPGQLIEYKVRPLFGISLYWMTEITHVQQKKYFIDEQRFGPYSLWHHQHHFREINGGVEMTDIVHYRIPGGIAGNMLNALYIQKKLEDIFEYRFKKAEQIFGAWKTASLPATLQNDTH